MARSENSRAWAALLDRIAPPKVVVSDGGPGFTTARRKAWPTTRVQRCTFHAFSQVKRYTTRNPKLPAGRELYGLALGLMHINDIDQATQWLNRYNSWCVKWKDFLEETTDTKNGKVLTHERLVKARNTLNSLIRTQNLFTYLNAELGENIPATNNMIEGGTNTQLRYLLRNHRGLSLVKQIKAVFWHCYMHTENPPATSTDPESNAHRPRHRTLLPTNKPRPTEKPGHTNLGRLNHLAGPPPHHPTPNQLGLTPYTLFVL